MNETLALPRRARPLLGTLVEICADGAGAVEPAFDAVARVQARMSRFDPASDIGRFNAGQAGDVIEVDAWTAQVLQAARQLQAQTGGRFDISLGSAPEGWQCEGTRLYKLDSACRLDLGGIAKGFAVDRAIDAMLAAGAPCGWVNAGGDLRVFGPLDLPVMLRDEAQGGVREFGHLADGAIATSCLGEHLRSRLAPRGGQTAAGRAPLHLSVLAAECLWADALTKVVASFGQDADGLCRRSAHRSSTECPSPELAALLRQHGAQAWWH